VQTSDLISAQLVIGRDLVQSNWVLAIIVVNFRTPDLTINCLRSLESEISQKPGIHVFVVENGSGDDSSTRIRDAIRAIGWAPWCSVEVSETNRGFSGGNNFGISAVNRRGGAKYILLLNSDTRVHPGCLARCIEVMEADPEIGALSCRVIGADGKIQNVCRRFPSPIRCLASALSLPWRFPKLFSWADCEDLGWDRNKLARDVEWIGGAFMMLRGEWIARHKALDERFFFYGEDVELCYRIWKSGLRCRYDPTATVVHLGGGSSDPSRMGSDTRNYHAWRARYLIQGICYGMIAKRCVQSVDILTELRRVVWSRIAARGERLQKDADIEVLRMLVRNWNRWSKSGT
jgi:N-acetylglucosaminyl-diphospho-decaprenol L-rhamnosyltransferase